MKAQSYGLTCRRSVATAVTLLLGCAVAPGQYMGPAVASPPTPAGVTTAVIAAANRDVKIAPGDVIAIAAYGVPELTTASQTSSGALTFATASPPLLGIKIGAMGEVSLPYVGSVKLAGMTPGEASVYLGHALKAGGFLVDPQISVEMVDSPTRAVTVIGEVAKPSSVPAFGNIRLLDAISACGGFTTLASHQITVQHRGEAAPILIELGTDAMSAAASNISLLPGDTIVVPKVGSVFVVGYVKSPAAIPLTSNAPITVLRALAMAGGVNYGAGLSKARIIRTTADHRQIVIRLDLRKIMFGQQPDVALLSDDVLLVPANAFKAGMAGGGAGVAATLLLGAGDTATVFK